MNHYTIKLSNLTIVMEYDESKGMGASIGLNLFDPGAPVVFCPGVPVHVHEDHPGRIDPKAFGARVTYPPPKEPKPKRTVEGDTGLVQTEMPH